MVTPKFDYIISFYLEARRSSLHNDRVNEDLMFFARKHAEFLSENRQQLSALNKAYFAFNLVRHTEEEVRGLLEPILEELRVQDLVEIVTRPNQGLSYGAWDHTLQLALRKGQLPMYAFLCEDDYIPTTPMFYEPFYHKLEQGNNFVSCLFTNLKHRKKHAAISNGFVRYEGLSDILSARSEIFNTKAREGKDIYKAGGSIQLNFLDWFDQSKISDIADTHNIPYWWLPKGKSYRVGEMKFFGKEEGPIVIQPVDVQEQ